MPSFFDDDPGEAAELPRSAWRERMHAIIFRSDTLAGRAFDLALLWIILASVLVVMLDSVQHLHAYQPWFDALEWGFTILFTLEYGLRLLCARSARSYALGFYGIVDLISLLPSYLAALHGGQSLLVVRSLRLLRVFRILRLGSFLLEGRILVRALARAHRKILIFLSAVLILTIILGALMYLIESPESGFTSIPMSVYWAIVTLTTVGYGDIAPRTVLGRMVASFIMIIGYAIIAVPTGIVTVELSESSRRIDEATPCPRCAATHHSADARFCRLCGARLSQRSA